VLGAVRDRGNDTLANVLSIAWVPTMGNHCSDERVLVLDTGQLCKLNHFVCVVLLVADATCRKECVNAGVVLPQFWLPAAINRQP
jgi:hypothetical protein